MKTLFRTNAIHHRQEIKVHLHQLVAQLRDEVGPVTPREFKLGPELATEGRSDSATNFDDYEKQSEAAGRAELKLSRPGERGTHAPGR